MTVAYAKVLGWLCAQTFLCLFPCQKCCHLCVVNAHTIGSMEIHVNSPQRLRRSLILFAMVMENVYVPPSFSLWWKNKMVAAARKEIDFLWNPVLYIHVTVVLQMECFG